MFRFKSRNLARGYRAALSHRDLRLLLSGELISATGSWAYNVALAVYVYDRTHSAAWVSAVFLVRFVPAMLTSAYGGVVAERFERWRLLITDDFLLFSIQALLTLAAALTAPVPVLLAVAGCSAVVSTTYTPAVAAMIPQLAGEDDLVAANALNSTIDNLVIVLGPAAGAVMLLLGSPVVVFAVNAVTFLVAAALVSRIRARSRTSDVTAGGSQGPLRQIIEGLRAITESRVVLLLVSFSVLASLVYGTDTVLFVYISHHLLRAGSTGYGYLLAGLGVGGVLAAGLVNRLAALPRLGAIITVGMVIYCLPTALLIVVHSLPAAVVIEVVRGGGTLVVDVLAITALQRSVAPTMVARVFGVFFALVLAAISLGSVLAAVMITAVGLDSALLVVAIGIPALATLAYPMLHRIDSQAVKRLALLAPRIAVLEQLGIFAAGSRSVLERLAAACTETEAAPGQPIIREGDPADAFYVLLAGRVDVSARGEGASSHHLRDLLPISYFGEIGLLEGIPRTASVTATEACRLYRISGPEFLDALTSAPASAGFLEGAKTHLAISHPSYRPTHMDQGSPA